MRSHRRHAIARMLPVLLGFSPAACAGAPSESDEARALVAQVTDLELQDALESRHRALLALQKMRLNFDHLRGTRDRCVAAHTGLMLAEAAQSTARAELLQAGDGADGTGLPPEVADRIGRTIRRANDQREVARTAFEQCRDETRALAVEFR